jgi:hypothetical protein
MRKSNAVRKPLQQEPAPQDQPTAATSIRVTDFFGHPILNTDAIVDPEKRQIAELLNDTRKALNEFGDFISVFRTAVFLLETQMNSMRKELETITPPLEKIHRLLELVEDMPAAVRGELMIPLSDNGPPLAEGQHAPPEAEFSPSMATGFANEAAFCIDELRKMLKRVS